MINNDIPKLPLVKNSNNLVLKQVKRTENVAMYSVHLKENISKITGYEVFKIRIRKPEFIRDQSYPLREGFPKNSEFGNDAYSWLTISQAEKSYNKLIEKLAKQPEAIQGNAIST